MLRKLVILIFVTAVFWLAVTLLLNEQRQSAQQDGALQPELEPIVPHSVETQSNRVADISVHTPEELEILFERVEQLLDRPRTGNETPLVNLVLHGPEVEFFAIKNYDKYKAIVDHAAKLAALGAVDISICQTQMRSLGIATDEVPSFLRQVPFGPGEVESLIEKGFVYM
jgi:intracellular sulfur oxidation DsrE/DsrF family protein